VQEGLTSLVVPAFVRKNNGVIFNARRQQGTGLFPSGSPNFKNVMKVGFEFE
jgi:hypothetical protein